MPLTAGSAGHTTTMEISQPPWRLAYSPRDFGSPTELHGQALLQGGLGQARGQCLGLLKLCCPARAQLCQGVDGEGQLITGGDELGSLGQQLTQVRLVGMKLRVVPTIGPLPRCSGRDGGP